MLNNSWFRKQKPFLGYSGFGGGAAGLAAGGIAPAGPGPTNVSGGTAYSYNGKFVHIFTGSGASLIREGVISFTFLSVLCALRRTATSNEKSSL